MTLSPARTAIALLTAGLLAACAATETPAPTRTPTSTTASERTNHTLTELVDHPCQVLTDEEAEALGAYGDPIEDGTTEKYCLWVTGKGGVSFTPYPSVDQTADAANRQSMSATDVDGHPALLGAYIKNRGCVLYVSFGAGASFRVSESRHSEDPAAPGTCPLSPPFAKVILGKLR